MNADPHYVLLKTELLGPCIVQKVDERCTFVSLLYFKSKYPSYCKPYSRNIRFVETEFTLP